MILRDYQKECVEKSVLALGEHGNTLVVAPTGCHAKGTKVLMYSGYLKAVEDIVVGDAIMGPDSKPRIVEELCRGMEQMYEIRPIKGKPFVVNANHILSLERTNSGGKGDNKYSLPEGHIVNISVSDYLNQSNNFKHLYKLYRRGVDFNQKEEIPVDPYFLGVLLGDGSTANGQLNITTPDPEIISYIHDYAVRQNLTVRTEQIPDNEANTYHLTNKGQKCIFRSYLKELGIYGCKSQDKFIPHCYKVASRKTRMTILAGLLDTDGYTSGAIIEFTSASEQLAEDTAFIARSLGYMALPKPKIVNSTTYYRFYICGDLSELPMKVARKIPTARRQKKSVLRTGFTVHALDMDEYYGFTVNADHLYLLEDFTVTHNSGKTIILSAIIKEVLKDHPNYKV